MAAPPSLRVTAPSHSSTSMDDYSDISDFSTPEDTLSSIPEELQLKAGNKAIVVQVVRPREPRKQRNPSHVALCLQRKIGKGGHGACCPLADFGVVCMMSCRSSRVESCDGGRRCRIERIKAQ